MAIPIGRRKLVAMMLAPVRALIVAEQPRTREPVERKGRVNDGVATARAGPRRHSPVTMCAQARK